MDFYTLPKSFAKHPPRKMLGTEGGRVIPVACNFSEYPHISNLSDFVAVLQRALLTALNTKKILLHVPYACTYPPPGG